MGIKERSAARQKRIVAHRSANFKDAENWGLDFWQSQTPEQRLSALVAIRRDIRKVELTNLPFHHRDPFDRMLVAQAMVDGMKLLSCDNRLSSYEIKRIW